MPTNPFHVIAAIGVRDPIVGEGGTSYGGVGYTARLHHKGVPLSPWRYVKG